MYYFIVNPNAGWGKGGRVWRVLSCYMEKHQVEYEAYLTTEKGEAKTIARKLTEGRKEPLMIIGVGGDGTMNELVDGLVFCAPVTLGYIPAGSANDLRRGLKLTSSPLKGLKRIFAGRRHRTVDYGVLSYGEQEVEHRRFLVSVGIGMDAAVCQELSEKRQRGRKFGPAGRSLSYILTGLKQILKCRPCKGYIILDGVKRVEFNHIAFISCHIQPYEGGGFKFAPNADCSDGRLEVCVASHASRRKLISVFLEAFRGVRRQKGIRCYQCGEVVIHTERLLPVHADGESCSLHNELQIACVPRKVRVVG